MTQMGRPDKTMRGHIEKFQRSIEDLSTQDLQKWDAFLWSHTIDNPGVHLAEKQTILRRIFVTIRHGGLIYRTNQSFKHWRTYAETGWPIASALSHGGRLMIQLPRTCPGFQGEDHSFWNWLTDGDEGQLVKKRSGTHATGNRPPVVVGGNRIKILEELKGKRHGATQGYRKILSGGADKPAKGQSYGMDIALGGHGNDSPATRTVITDNGDHGHLYLFYRPPTPEKFGGILIGVEGEAPGHWGQSGNFHSPNIGVIDKVMGWRKSKSEALFGEKWAEKGAHMSSRIRFGHLLGPDRYDSTRIDLSSSGWRFLLNCEQHWNNSMVAQPAEPPCTIQTVTKRLNMPNDPHYNRLPPFALQYRLAWFVNTRITSNPQQINHRWRDLANEEFRELIHAIYGGVTVPLSLMF